MLLRAPGAVNFSRPRPGWLFEWVVTRIGRGAKKGVATVLRGSGTPRGDDARSARYITDGKRGTREVAEVANAVHTRQGAAGGGEGRLTCSRHVDIPGNLIMPFHYEHRAPRHSTSSTIYG